MRPSASLLLLYLAFAATFACAQEPLPADEFRLTIRELSGKEAKAVPLGTSCTGEAQNTLPCAAVSVTLENVGPHIVRVVELQCSDPQVLIERAEPKSSSGWSPVSRVISKCHYGGDLPRTNTRLRPGQKTTYTTRLISPNRDLEMFSPASGTFALRAHWPVQLCVDKDQASDCFTPLLNRSPGSTWQPVSSLPYISLTSNTIDVTFKPITADLGPLSFSFDVTALPDGQAMPLPPNAVTYQDPHCPAGTLSAECTTFHYVIHNTGSRPVRHARFTCSGDDILPEYRSETGPWTKFGPLAWTCTRNILYERPILAGGSIDGYFTLRQLTPGWNTNPLRAAGTYSFRFTFRSNVCIASPDGSFCLVRPEKQATALSREVTINATAALGKPYTHHGSVE